MMFVGYILASVAVNECKKDQRPFDWGIQILTNLKG